MRSLTFKKIMIFGRPGSEKSTFAKWLSEILGLPLHHLEKHFYISNWVERNYNEFLQIQKNIVDTEYWIVDGNSTHSLEMRWANADLVLYFNFPKIICYLRIFKRFLNPNKALNPKFRTIMTIMFAICLFLNKVYLEHIMSNVIKSI